MTNKEYTEMVLKDAMGLKEYCQLRECFDYDEDVNGRVWITNHCPFLEDVDAPWECGCKIGKPRDWGLDE